jgi:hypothetical protein
MQDDLVEGLLNDSASVWHLVHSIEQFVREQLASHTYTEATVSFFDYVSKLAKGTKRILSPQDTLIARAKLATLKDYWRLLHELIKPAADAHSLAAPAVLIDLRHINSINSRASMQRRSSSRCPPGSCTIRLGTRRSPTLVGK